LLVQYREKLDMFAYTDHIQTIKSQSER